VLKKVKIFDEMVIGVVTYSSRNTSVFMISTVRKQLEMQAKMQSRIQSLRTENYAVSGVVGFIVTTGVQMVQSPFKEFPSEMLSVLSINYCKILSKNVCVYACPLIQQERRHTKYDN
jgi:hypothetical protein